MLQIIKTIDKFLSPLTTNYANIIALIGLIASVLCIVQLFIPCIKNVFNKSETNINSETNIITVFSSPGCIAVIILFTTAIFFYSVLCAIMSNNNPQTPNPNPTQVITCAPTTNIENSPTPAQFFTQVPTIVPTPTLTQTVIPTQTITPIPTSTVKNIITPTPKISSTDMLKHTIKLIMESTPKISPADMLKQNYSAINNKKFEEAYNLRSKFRKSKTTYKEFYNIWKNNNCISLKETETLYQTDKKAKVKIKLYSEDTNPDTGEISKIYYSGVVYLINEDNTWKIDDSDIKKSYTVPVPTSKPEKPIPIEEPLKSIPTEVYVEPIPTKIQDNPTPVIF
ncbi:MAG: hypothetical protein ABRQ39_30750 [Candidatus Eremiobacterota bacterium]